jgi:hypothetical protein
MSVIDQKVYTDGLEVDLLIDGQEWHLIEARVELTTADSPDYVDMIIYPTEETQNNLPDDPTLKSSEGGLLGTDFTIDIDTELQAPPRGPETTRIFTGKLANLSTAAQGAWEAIAFDPSHQAFEVDGPKGSFLNTKIDVSGATGASKESEGYPRQSTSYDTPSKSTPGKSQISATDLVDAIIEASPLDESNVVTNFDRRPGVKIGETPEGEAIYGGIDNELTFSEQEVSARKALNKIEESTRSTWWFDREGVLHIGAPEPGNPIETWNIRFIKETSAGLSTPAWQSVRVIGSGVASNEGWNKSNLNSTELLIKDKTIEYETGIPTEDLPEPVFTYRNLEIQTEAEANDVADKLIDKIREQEAEGKVTVVGFPEIRPLDAIEMPNEQPQPMGGNRYSVVKVVHKINGSDGFVTDIHVGGVPAIQQTSFDEPEAEESEKTFFVPRADSDA